jgi:putative acetyltransferase
LLTVRATGATLLGQIFAENAMPTTIREMRPKDARAFLEVHHAAAHGIAGQDYPSAVIEAWAPLPITDRHVERVLSNPDHEYRVIAEINGLIAGIGALVLKNAELCACYVAPNASRKGVGSLIMREIERAARQHGVKTLDLDATITAESFYESLGYSVRERGEHVLQGGQLMACVKMYKVLVSRES